MDTNVWEQKQQEWLRNLILAYKPNTVLPDNLWSRVSEMVGFLNGGGSELVETPHLRSPEANGEPPKRLVCSPDLPVFSNPFEGQQQKAPVGGIMTTTPSPVSAPADTSLPTSTTNIPLDMDKSLKCNFCGKTFTQRATYQTHVRTHGKEASGSEDPYQCNYCGKTFAVPARLTRHYRTHTGEKPYQCDLCDKSFSVKENLSVHRRIHTKERPYKCEVCERAFEHSGKLHRHMRIHTGERPHKCSVCAKTFIQSGQLVIHMRTHTGEKPYVCKECGKGFTCSKQLKVHTRTHTGEKPYTCDICGKSFGYNHVLKLHQVAHYGEKVYKCTICKETFTSKKTMEAHIKSHAESPTPSTTSSATTITTTSSSESSCASDKENKEAEMNNYYIFPNQIHQGVNPALLVAAEAAAACEDLPLPNNTPVPAPPPPPPPIEPVHESVYICPEPLRRVIYEEPIGVEDPLLTPPSSNPESPNASPDPPRHELSLPPRKRSRMILESMGSPPPLRQNSVIQYAGAS